MACARMCVSVTAVTSTGYVGVSSFNWRRRWAPAAASRNNGGHQHRNLWRISGVNGISGAHGVSARGALALHINMSGDGETAMKRPLRRVGRGVKEEGGEAGSIGVRRGYSW